MASRRPPASAASRPRGAATPPRGAVTPRSAPDPAPQGLTGRLTAKVGPLPVYAWALMIVGVGYLAYRHYSTGGGSGSSSVASGGATGAPGSGTLGTQADTSGAAGGASAGAAGAASDNGYGTITALLGQQGAALDSLSAQVAAGTPYQPTAAGGVEVPTQTPPAGVTSTAPQPNSFNDPRIARVDVVANVNQPYATPASAPDFATTAQAKTAAAKAAGASAPFGGVVNVKTLANGSTLTTYATGRQVQQVPGKSAYVVKK